MDLDTFSTGDLDYEAVAAGLAKWFTAQWPERAGLELASLTGHAANGRSSETLFAHLRWHDDGDARDEELVVRLPPVGDGLFPTYDLDLQGKCMEAVRGAGLPAPRVVAFEGSDEWVGSPFLVMGRVHGRVPGDFLTEEDSPWLHGASDAERATLMDSFVETMAGIHALDWEALGLGAAARPGGTGLAAEVDWWKYHTDWGYDGETPSELVDLFAWIGETRPRTEPPLALVWGDARLGNVIVDDAFHVAAALDWEMACICPAEVDLAWFVTYQDRFCAAAPLALRDREQIIARYEARRGSAVGDLQWYERFAHVRSAALGASMQRIFRERDPAMFEAMAPMRAEALAGFRSMMEGGR